MECGLLRPSCLCWPTYPSPLNRSSWVFVSWTQNGRGLRRTQLFRTRFLWKLHSQERSSQRFSLEVYHSGTLWNPSNFWSCTKILTMIVYSFGPALLPLEDWMVALVALHRFASLCRVGVASASCKLGVKSHSLPRLYTLVFQQRYVGFLANWSFCDSSTVATKHFSVSESATMKMNEAEDCCTWTAFSSSSVWVSMMHLSLWTALGCFDLFRVPAFVK